MAYRFTSEDGLAQSNDIAIVEHWNNIVRKQKSEVKDWVYYLRENGVKAAHPDDGWVDRDNNSVQLVYPQFDDGLHTGDTLALGWPGEFRLVTISKAVREGMLNPHIEYYFKADTQGSNAVKPQTES